MDGLIPEAYAPYAERIFACFAHPGAVTTESDVSERCGVPRTMPRGSSDFQRVPTRWGWLSQDKRRWHRALRRRRLGFDLVVPPNSALKRKVGNSWASISGRDDGETGFQYFAQVYRCVVGVMPTEFRSAL